MIELQGLTKRYGDKTAVDHLTFTVRPGVVTGFLGPNGAGKSTTMRMLLGLDNPTSGSVRIDGKHYAQLSEPLKYIGALLDAKAIHGGRTAYNHLLCMAQSNRIPKHRVDEVLETVGLSAVAKKRSKGFSLGMGQRLGIAGALLGDPEILMFDEPVNGLDPEGIHWIRNLMKGLAAQGRTVFVSSHLMSEMALTADHLIVIGRGRLMADTSMSDFIEKNSRSYVRLRSPQQERFKDVMAKAGYTVVETGDGAFEITDGDAAALGELAAQHQLVLHELSPQRASLEEAFMQLTAESVEYHAHGQVGPGPVGGPGAPVPGSAAGQQPGAPAGQPPYGSSPYGASPYGASPYGPGQGVPQGQGQGAPQGQGWQQPGQGGQAAPPPPAAPEWGAQWRDNGKKKGH
ncbi:ABC transporter ATP-binding protein [Streptomyces sp. NBC_00448]|uniref:ABC transporter ATP-binding protein n=1 Tax=Streptomyces sp. NBC_00448 TaxID=2903652 RepID=UPI002E2389C2